MRSVLSFQPRIRRISLQTRKLHTNVEKNAFRIAVIGFGPSGYYTANYLNKELSNSKESLGFVTKIDVIDRFAVGGGLVRSGVAPDHPEVKNINNQLLQLFTSSQDKKPEENEVNFFGNIEIGRTSQLQFDKENLFLQIPFSMIEESYHAIVICCGAEMEKRLKIGEGIRGVYSAGSFVRYYNAGVFPNTLTDPSDFCDGSDLISFPSDTTINSSSDLTLSASVIGHGNVGLDIARVILKGNSNEMKSTDITSRTLHKLSTSNINTIHIFGRRGPAQSSFTTKELRELLDLQNCVTYVCEEDIKMLNQESQVEMKESRAKQRMIQLLASTATLLPFNDFISLSTSESFEHKTLSDQYYSLSVEDEKDCDARAVEVGGDGALKKRKKRCFIHYFSNPHKYHYYLENDQKVLNGIEIERTKLTGAPNSQNAIGTSQFFSFPRLIASFESIGYHQLPLFSSSLSFKRHQNGRIVNDNGEVVDGVYTSGWYKRGPSGIVGSNIPDAKETVSSLIFDIPSLQKKSINYNGIADLLQHSKFDTHLLNTHVSKYDDWLKIEEEEKKRTQLPSKSAEKFTDNQQIVSFLSSLRK